MSNQHLNKISRKSKDLPSIHPAFDPSVEFPKFYGRDGSFIEIFPTVFESFMLRLKGRERYNYELENPVEAFTFDFMSSSDGADLWKMTLSMFQSALWFTVVSDAWLTYSMKRSHPGKDRHLYQRNYRLARNADISALKNRDYAGKIHLLLDTISFQTYFLDGMDFFVAFRRFVLRFYPNLLKKNPFQTPEEFKFPYEHINFTYFITVQHLRDAIAFLDYAEQERMDFRTFNDFVYNTCRCRDERLKSRRYIYQLYKNRTVKIMDLLGPDNTIARAAGLKYGVISR